MSRITAYEKGKRVATTLVNNNAVSEGGFKLPTDCVQRILELKEQLQKVNPFIDLCERIQFDAGFIFTFNPQGVDKTFLLELIGFIEEIGPYQYHLLANNSKLLNTSI